MTEAPQYLFLSNLVSSYQVKSFNSELSILRSSRDLGSKNNELIQHFLLLISCRVLNKHCA